MRSVGACGESYDAGLLSTRSSAGFNHKDSQCSHAE